ncbi:ABC transporter ATP-binding protein [Methylobacterium brachythecii]|uniref:Iron ABC transporter ATP-binding protein n=1 Tax=Methylobacterium brachythecii TaxID=1176177 RepID=A0A7W6F536_9HYPH|nr:ABC transporter ATP-binding protein [Methylobacterium brachythecii]MBB3900937.1 iron(III) transport system ATP-binding protein [Methylobacterium brachythecii]GLS46133.1 iron ABC transporter ATP-binding protein [Methylobacterium brachythecii]
MLAPQPGPRLELRAVCRRFGHAIAVDDVSMSVMSGEILAILGASGCGKTTLLRIIAGLESAGSGSIHIDGHRVAGEGIDVPPEARGVGLMFQDYALFPHMSLLANVCFGLHGIPRRQARAIGLDRLREVGLDHRSDSYPHALSGGEAQRVALARALAPGPRLLLLDEPFSNLDQDTRDRVRTDTIELLRKSGTTAMVVTHDPSEALRIADRIVLMRAGRVVQVGTPEEIYRSPATPFAAAALGVVLALPGNARGDTVDTPLGCIPAGHSTATPKVWVWLRPEAIRIGPSGSGTPARVLRRDFDGAGRRLHLAVDGLDAPLVLSIPAGDAAVLGDRIGLTLDAAEPCLVTDAD